MNIVFFGNTKYSVIVAKALLEHFGLAAVVTIPNSPIKTFAQEHKIPVIDSSLISSNTPDFLIVCDYGLLLPKKLLDIPKYAALNVHHSLLPKYRGPSPAPTAILNGDKISGVTIIRMNEELDAGDILAQKEYTLKSDETTPNLLTKLNTLGGEIIISVIEDYIAGNVKPIPQNEKEATFTKRINKQDGYVNLENPPHFQQLDRMIRSYYPWPGVWTLLRLKASEGQAKIVKFLPNKIIQVEGKRPMNYKDFLNGYQQLLEEPVKKFLLF